MIGVGPNIGIGPMRLSNVGGGWTILISGLTQYRRGLSSGYYVLDYSPDGGITWKNLISQDPTEESPIRDLSNQYRHRIVDDEYRVDQTLTPTGYAGTEGTDWENIATHIG